MKDDQGSHFTSVAFTEALKAASVQIRMDGKGAASTMYSSNRYRATGSTRRNNCRRTDSVSQVLQSSGHLLHCYNSFRTHSSLDGRTPDEVYLVTQRLKQSA